VSGFPDGGETASGSSASNVSENNGPVNKGKFEELKRFSGRYGDRADQGHRNAAVRDLLERRPDRVHRPSSVTGASTSRTFALAAGEVASAQLSYGLPDPRHRSPGATAPRGAFMAEGPPVRRGDASDGRLIGRTTAPGEVP
jgi:hypothetical protein